MVLNHMGRAVSQRRLNRMLELGSIGVPLSQIHRLSSLGIVVEVSAGTISSLKQSIDNRLPVIVFVVTGHLSYWPENIQHAMVVIGYDDNLVFLNDPAVANAPLSVPWDEFMLAWLEFDYACAVLTRRA